MNKELLGYYLKRKGITQEELAEKIGISRQSLINKMNEYVDWKLSEIKSVQEFLKLEDADIKAIFFTNEVK